MAGMVEVWIVMEVSITLFHTLLCLVPPSTRLSNGEHEPYVVLLCPLSFLYKTTFRSKT